MSTRYVWYTYNVDNKTVSDPNASTPQYTKYTYKIGAAYRAAVGTGYNYLSSSKPTDARYVLTGYTYIPYASSNFRINAKQNPYLIAGWFEGSGSSPVYPDLFYNKFQNSYDEDLYWMIQPFTSSGNYVSANLLLVKKSDISKVTLNNYTSYAQMMGYMYSKTIEVQGTSKQGTVVSNTSSAYPSDGKQNNLWYVYQGSDSIDPVSVEYSKTGDIYGGEKITVTANKGSPKFGGTVYYLYQYSVNGSTWTNSGEKSSSSSRVITVPEGAKQFQVRVLASDSYGFTSTTYVYGTTLGVQNLKLYQGVSNKSRAGEKLYFGVNGKSREVIKGYIGVNGKSKSFL